MASVSWASILNEKAKEEVSRNQQLQTTPCVEAKSGFVRLQLAYEKGRVDASGVTAPPTQHTVGKVNSKQRKLFTR